MKTRMQRHAKKYNTYYDRVVIIAISVAVGALFAFIVLGGPR